MEKITFTVPALYADHHVTNVKRLLSPISGVENVIASSAFREVTVEFDRSKTSADALKKALASAGYVPGPMEAVKKPEYAKPDPAWEVLGTRAVTTNPVDLQLSGEFRKY